MTGERYKYFEEANPAVVRLLPSKSRVLDVGCGYGALAPELKRLENYCAGIDVNESALEYARERYDEVYQGDLEGETALPFAPDTRFDVIIFGDVLEHLYDPAAVLERFKAVLEPGGFIIVSVPNLVTWPVRLLVLFGRFRYTPTGTLDWTHIRFFTRSTSRELIENAGFTIERATVTPNFVRVLLPWVRKWFLKNTDSPDDNPRAIVDSAPYQFYIRYVFPIETFVASLWKNLFAFQFVYTARL